MRLLLINTGGVEGSVALAEGGQLVAAEELPGRTSSEHLVPAVRGLLMVQGWRLKDLAAVAVVHGPGSFTGVRVGLSAAKGLSEAGVVPLIGISRLALVAVSAGGEGVVHVGLDAGRGEFYYGRYVDGRREEEALLPGEQVMVRVGQGRIVATEEKVLAALGVLDVVLMREPVASDVLPLAMERVKRGEFDDAMTLDANYLRRTDTEILAKLAAHGISV